MRPVPGRRFRGYPRRLRLVWVRLPLKGSRRSTAEAEQSAAPGQHPERDPLHPKEKTI
jgi:hypothetical protein